MQWASTNLLNIHCTFFFVVPDICGLLRLLFLLYLAFLFNILRFSFYFSVHLTCSKSLSLGNGEKLAHFIGEKDCWLHCYIDQGNSRVCQLQVYIKKIISVKLGVIIYKTNSELCSLDKANQSPLSLSQKRWNLWLILQKLAVLKNKWSCFQQFQEDYNFSPEALGAEPTVFPLIKRCNCVDNKVY